MTRAVIFDMDGTLFQTDKILEVALEDTFHDLRSKGEWEKEAPVDQYREIMGVPLPKVWQTLLPNHSRQRREYVDAFFLGRLVENIREGKGELYPYVKETFQELIDNQFSIYIASNGLVNYLQAIIQYYQLDRWVTEPFSIEQIESNHKVDLVREIIDKYAISDGAVVGDRLSDIQAAKANELVSIGCDFDFAKQEEMEQADVVITDLREVKEKIHILSE